MISRYAVTIEGRAHDVELEDVDGGKLRVAVDGKERLLDARALAGGVWSLVDGHNARLIQVDGAAAKLTVEVSHPDGEPRICLAEVTDTRAPRAGAPGRAAVEGPLTLRAPIPGRVVKILVKAGQAVKAGEALIVLEAMKMENELRSPRAAVVTTVQATQGDAVEAGQALVSLD